LFRRLALTLVAVGASGCFRAALVEDQRRPLLAARLDQAVFPGPLPRLRERLLARIVDARLPVDTLTPESWTFCLERGCCAVVAGADDARLVHLTDEQGNLTGCRQRVWRALAPEASEAGFAQLDADAEAATAAFERDFHGPWAPTATAYLGFLTQPTVLSWGVTAGVRKWASPYLVPALVAGYEQAPGPEHHLSLGPRVEVTSWSTRSAFLGLPDASISLGAAPVLVIGHETRVGFQAAMGLHAFYGALELGTLEAGGVLSFRATLGVGL
jgi:hypothetical protein